MSKTKSGSLHKMEVRAGEGYLSQPAADLYFLDHDDDPILELLIRWSDGSEQTVPFDSIREKRESGSRKAIVIEKQK